MQRKQYKVKIYSLFYLSGHRSTNEHPDKYLCIAHPGMSSSTEYLIHLNFRGQPLFSVGLIDQLLKRKPNFAHNIAFPQITHEITVEKDEHL